MPETSATDDLQFNTIEPLPTTASTGQVKNCARCRRPLTSSFYALRDYAFCGDCKNELQNPPGSAAARLIKSIVFGAGTGLVGMLIWFAVRRVLGMEIGLIAVLVGYMVGKAVYRGSGGRGGTGFQVLAVALTYSSICANYLPDLFFGPNSIEPTMPHIWKAFQLSLRLPFEDGMRSPIGLLIIGFALWEAWKFSRGRTLTFSGPFAVATGVAPAGTLPPALPVSETVL